MRLFILFLISTIVAFCFIGCVGTQTTTAPVQPVISQEQAVAGVTYLNESATKMLDLLNKAKADNPSVTAKVDAAASVVEQAITATEAFKNNSTEKKWGIAKSALDAAVTAALPIVVNTLLK